MVRVGLVQLCSGLDPRANIDAISDHVENAVSGGASYVLTPEVSVAFAGNRAALAEVAGPFENNPAVAELAALSHQHGIHLHVGSMAFARADGRFANRSLLFGSDGELVAHYDKIHLFDADPPGDRPYRESDTYRGGDVAVVTDVAGFRLGMTICYDLRFPALYATLAEAGAEVMAVPSAFTVPTGSAHWHVLIRARAIETGSYVLAAAQGGSHENGRITYGHSLVVDPWGRVMAEKTDGEPGVIFADLDLGAVAEARQRLPALANRRRFSLSVNITAPE